MSKTSTKKVTRNTLFWSYWGKVKKKLQEADYTDEEVEAERQEMLKLAGAKPDTKGRFSTKHLNNSQFNTVLDYCDMLLGKPNQKRRSSAIIYRINKLIETTDGMTDAYLNEITQKIYKIDDWKTLPLPDLEKFKLTAIQRSRSFNQKVDE